MGLVEHAASDSLPVIGFHRAKVGKVRFLDPEELNAARRTGLAVN